MLKLVSFHIQEHLNVFLHILEYLSQSVEVDGLNLLAYSVFELFDSAGCIFCTLCPSIGPKERSRQPLDREIWVAKCFFEINLSLKKLSISCMLAFEM
jgi:hypothetical protein